MRRFTRSVCALVGAVLLVLALLSMLSSVPLFAMERNESFVCAIAGIAALIASRHLERARLTLIVIGIVFGLIVALSYAVAGDILGLFDVSRNRTVFYGVLATTSLITGLGTAPKRRSKP